MKTPPSPRLVHLLLLTLGGVLATQAHAQTAKTIAEEYDKVIKSAQTITAFGPDLFGEAVNLKDGDTSFSATDVSVRTNSGLPVTIGRSYGVNTRDIDEYVDLAADGELFGNWKLDVPHMSGIYDERTGWVTTMPNPQQRCSVSSWSNSGPPAVQSVPSGWNLIYYPEDYWSGNRITIPSKGQYPLLYLPTGHTRPSDGNSYYWTTKGDWRVRCAGSLKNGAGEGFIVVLPDGTKYTFDWLSSRKVAALEGTNCNVNYGCTGKQIVVNRREYFLHATKVEDRFGNWVAYDFDPAHPRRLRSITSNDGAAINLAYGTNGKITSISAGERTWQYQYTSADNGILAAVVQPDTSRWTFQYGNLYQILHHENQKIKWLDCEPVIFGTATGSLTIGHPSGAQGVFTFRNTMHGTDRTPGGCSVPNPDKPLQADLSSTLMVYKVASLLSKQVSGPGLTSQTWSYAYQPSWSWNPIAYVDDCTPAYVNCNSTTSTEVSAPDGSVTRSIFGNDYFRTAGQLLSVQVISDNATLQTTTNTYMPDAVNQAYPDRIGWDPFARSNKLETEKLRPQRASAILRDGVTFTSQTEICSGSTYCFDAYARSYKTRKYNSLGSSRIDSVVYHDNINLWVMGQVASSTNADTGMTESQTDFDALSRPWKTYAFGKLQGTLNYNADGTLASVADGRNHVTSVSSWKRGIPRSIQHPPTPDSPSGAIESAVVDDNGWITSVTDENGYATSYAYDTMGRLSGVTYPASDSVAWLPQSREFRALTSSDWLPPGISVGQWRHYEGEGNRAKYTYYDAMWRPVLVQEYDTSNVAATLRYIRSAYDSDGRLSFQSYPGSDPAALTTGTRTFYDALDRTTRVEQDSELSVLATTTEYLSDLQVRVTNPRNLQTTTSFMAWDQPGYEMAIASVQPESKVIDIVRHPQFGWPLQLKQRSADNTLQQTRRYVYDGNAQLCKTIEPETGATVTGYDGAGNPVWSAAGLDSITYASTSDCNYAAASGSGRVVNRTYDARNRLTHLTFPDGRGNQVWTYEKDSLPASVTTYNGTGNTTPVVTAYTYNKRRLPTGESLSQPTHPYTWGIGYEYDTIGHLRWQSYPTGLKLDFAPNALGQSTQARNANQSSIYYASGAEYFPNGALKQFTYGNGIVHSMTQNARQLPARVTSSFGVNDFTYNYDANANITNIWDLGRGDHYSRWMTYDHLDRLTSAGSGSFGGDAWHRFTYDAVDNIRSWKLAGVKDYADYLYESGTNRLTSIRNTAGAPVVNIDYDVQGNLANKDGQAYEFDYGNRLRNVPGKEAYRYDGLGRRVQTTKADGSQTTLWLYGQAGQMLFSSDWNGPSHLNQKTHEFVYLAGSLVATIDHDWPSNTVIATTYQHTDALGSPVAVTNESGSVVERNDYEPWGAIIGNPTRSGIGYTGHVMDGATGLTYMQQRYYDHGIGRFLSVDPVSARLRGDNFNRYAYGFNSPYRFTDPDGRDGMETIGETMQWADMEFVQSQNAFSEQFNASPVGGLIVDTVISTAVDFLTAGPNGDGFVYFGSLRVARATAKTGDVVTAGGGAKKALHGAEHTKNARASTKGKHERGQARRQQDRGGEKGDASRAPPRKAPPGHKGPWPPKPPKPPKPPEPPKPAG